MVSYGLVSQWSQGGTLTKSDESAWCHQKISYALVWTWDIPSNNHLKMGHSPWKTMKAETLYFRGRLGPGWSAGKRPGSTKAPRPTTQGKPWGHSTPASMPLLWPSAEATRNPGLDDLNASVCLKTDEYIYIYNCSMGIYIYMYTHQYSYIMVMLEIWCWYWGEYGHSVAESVIFRCLKMELYLEHATR